MALGAIRSAVSDQAPRVREAIQTLKNAFIVRLSDEVGIRGLAFSTLLQSTLSMNADISVHFAEDNSALTDHIAVKPTTIRLRGFIGSIATPDRTLKAQAAQDLVSTLSPLAAFYPPLTSAIQAQLNQIVDQSERLLSTVGRIENATSALDNVVSFLEPDNPADTPQARAIATLQSIMKSKVLLDVQTPYSILSNMALKRVVAIEDGQKPYRSDLDITLQQVRISRTQVASVSADRIRSFANRAKQQAVPVDDKGQVKGQAVDITGSILSGIRAAGGDKLATYFRQVYQRD